MLEKINLTKFFESSLDYPKEYNPRVHGPYNPATYYGPKTQAFSEVKLGEVGKWFGQREKSVSSLMNFLTRGNENLEATKLCLILHFILICVCMCTRFIAVWRYKHKYVLPQKAGATPIYHLVAVSIVAFYLFGGEFTERRKLVFLTCL
jgi:F-type H+-transporting ATPase subunit f